MATPFASIPPELNSPSTARHEEQRQESGDDPRSIPGVCLVERGAGGNEQRPQKGDGSEERRDRNCETS
jgi:hypothetical protein